MRRVFVGLFGLLLVLVVGLAPFVFAATYYHAVVAANDNVSGSLLSTVPVGGTVYVTFQLNVVGMGNLGEENPSFYFQLVDSGAGEGKIYVAADGFLLGGYATNGYTVALSGDELVSVRLNDSGVVIWVSGVQVYDELYVGSAWVAPLSTYQVWWYSGTGSFEVWVTDSPYVAPVPTLSPFPNGFRDVGYGWAGLLLALMLFGLVAGVVWVFVNSDFPLILKLVLLLVAVFVIVSIGVYAWSLLL